MSKQGKAGRTKGEWKTDPLNSLSIIDDAEDRFHGLICQTNGKSRDEALANRDFIILAVNNHENLIETLKEAYAELRFHNWHNSTAGNKIDALLKSLSPNPIH